MYLPRGPVGKIIEFYLHFAPFRGALTVQLPELGEALGNSQGQQGGISWLQCWLIEKLFCLGRRGKSEMSRMSHKIARFDRCQKFP